MSTTANGDKQIQDPISDGVLTREPDRVFWRCGGCKQVFWEGGMYSKAVDNLRGFLGERES